MLQYRLAMPIVLRRAAAVITISQFSKRDIVRRYCLPADKVFVAPGAADPFFRPERDVRRLADVRSRYRTGERYILSVASLEPRKNLARLIEAYVDAPASRHPYAQARACRPQGLALR